jgi:hypothetical protein
MSNLSLTYRRRVFIKPVAIFARNFGMEGVRMLQTTVRTIMDAAYQTV